MVRYLVKGGDILDLEKFYKIGEFASLIGVSTGTLRDYEKRGILLPHHKTSYGYRYYSHSQYLDIVERGLGGRNDT